MKTCKHIDIFLYVLSKIRIKNPRVSTSTRLVSPAAAKSAVSIRPNQRCQCPNHNSLLPGNSIHLYDQVPPQLLQCLPRHTAVVDEIALGGPVRVADHRQSA